MKRVWVHAIVLAFAITVSVTPHQSFKSQQWHINFQEQSGGLLSLLQLPQVELPKLVGMAIYTDWGILQPGRYEPVSSQNERNPKVSKGNIGGTKFVTVEGELKDNQGKPQGFRYRVVYWVYTDALKVDISLTAERSFKSMHGFLATMLNFVGADEWLALTQKGWFFAEITKDGRVFQSAHTPLDKGKQILGLANSKTGWGITLKLGEFKPNDNFENVFIHASPKGFGSIFIAWCDGISEKSMEAGDTWQFSAKLKFLRLDEIVSTEW